MKKYHVIYADPPWWYNERRTDAGTRFGGGIYSHYPPMRDTELLAMSTQVRGLSDRNCLLAMWATGPRIPIAVELIRAWGFRYATVGYVWVKTYASGVLCTCPGYYTSSTCEYVLLGATGSMRPYLKLQPQVYTCPRREHSRKPDEIRRALEASYPWGNWLELFARTTSPGWDVYGNETDKFTA